MPIDIGLLRSKEEGGNLEQVWQWQILRYGDKANHELLTSIQTMDVERRRLLRQVTDTRKQLHILQQSIKNSNDKQKVKAEMRQLKQQVIPDMERDLERATKQLDKTLPQVPNCVVELYIDESPCLSQGATDTFLFNQKPEETVVDPLYCLQGYDTLPGCTVLTGTGAALARSLSNYALLFCRNHTMLSSFSSVILPPSIEMESATAHSIMGCSLSDCLLCASSTSSVLVPPWVAASLLHEETKYFDQEIPVGQVITTTLCSGVAIDEREVARLQTFQSMQKTWVQQCLGDRIELFCLTGNTISESNVMQREMVDSIVEFYQSLLLVHHDSSSYEIKLWAVEPPQLLPCEASRVVVQGMLGKSVVILGYVSNMTDYSTRATKTKIGSSLGYCYAVHGVLCCIPETLEWMLQHNVIDYENEIGIGISPSLSGMVQEQLGMSPAEGVLFLPFVRRIHVNKKNGKVKRTELGNASAPRVIQSSSNPVEACHTTESGRLSRKPFVREGPLTAQDIQDERLSCPYNFLPIGR